VKALVLQHDDADSPGLLGEWLDANAFAWDLVRVFTEPLPRDASEAGLVVSLGSSYCALDDSQPWLPAELALLEDAVRRRVPTLGICFGGQLLCRALGGSVERDGATEVGWFDVESLDEELVAPGPWSQWHFDCFTPPAGATVLARGGGIAQAFSLGAALALQFHPEVTFAEMEQAVVADSAELDALGISADELLTETEREAPKARANALQLFDVYWRRVEATLTAP
jgi:GMP synthase-like glutamine amidotransferase